ncbi:ARM repeat superfamily protein, putative isoform 2 [Hibiscus syriacus]|uniref:ARM repeat superfamily protein, putative isoform 2 n=1 Tax=Hibiscus syriacus TaxID=106335 RepID=A0A6A3AP00_HIBSY|nr:ARM repeat superfamily protein, putative isoform 2 [Hibiscus syriacus]
MEKKLRSSLKASAEDFLSSAVKLTLKFSKAPLKSLIHSIPASSPLSSTLPSSLHLSISDSIRSFQNKTTHREADSSRSPPAKRTRRSSRSSNPQDVRVDDSSETLRTLAYITGLCVSHPRDVFQHSDLIPSVRSLHDSLVVFESDPVLSYEIACLCEEWWKRDLPEKEILISQTLPFLLSKSLTMKKKVDVHRVYSLREAFNLFDFEDESIEDLKLLLIRCVIEPLYLKTEEGKRFLAFAFGLNLQFLKECLAMIKAQIPFGRKSMLEAYGEIVFKGWKGVEGELKREIEDGFLMGLVEGAIHASSKGLGSSIRRVLGGFINQRTVDGVEKLLFRLAEPLIFRSLQVANSNVRQNALHLLLDLFPFEDPDATKEAKDTLLDKQFFLLEKLLMDDCPDVRVIAVEGCFRILHLFWEIIPPPTITKMITKVFDEMAYDACSEIRFSTLIGIVYLLGNPQSHEILKVLLPRLGHLMLDNVLSVRVAMVDLLLLLKDIRTFQFNKVVGLEVLLNTLSNDQPPVAQKITRLLMPSYFPARLAIEEACDRCVTLMKRSPLAGARFCEFVLLEGVSLKSMMELVKVFISLLLSNAKLGAPVVEGLLVASANLCSSLANEQTQQDSLRELFSGERVKRLLAVASTAHARSSIFDMLSSTASDNVVELVGNCMSIVTDCSDLSENLEKQAEVRSSHKLLTSCVSFDDMFEALTRLLQKTAYRCHFKFGTEAPKQNVSPAKRKKSKSSSKTSVKWKHVSGKKSSNFKDDYSVAIGVSWQIKDMLSSENTRKAMMSAQALELPFLALKIISEVSIVQCEYYEYMDPYPVLAYTSLALQMALQNVRVSNATESGTKKDEQIKSSDKLFEEGDSEKNAKSLPKSKQSKRASRLEKKQGEPQTDASGSNTDGSVYTKQKQMSKRVTMFTTVLKFIVDSMTMGFAHRNHTRCLRFTSAYIQYIISCLRRLSTDKSQLKEENSKQCFVCVKSSFSYAFKLLNLVHNAATEASPAPVESFNLANDLLDLIISGELFLGSNYAAQLVAVAKPWLPDLILALGSTSMLEQSIEKPYLTALEHIKLHFPSWPLILAKIELAEMSEHDRDDKDSQVSEPEFFEFKKLVAIIISLLKRNRSILDAIGVIFLATSVIGLERKDLDLLLGLLSFVCRKLIGQEDREWRGLDMMLVSLPDVYPRIEREIGEQDDDKDKDEDEDESHNKLASAKALLEPVWLYHVYETQKFSEVAQ